jgi:hypothetical protein
MARPPNAFRPLAEELLRLPGAELKHMFGAESIYVEGLLLLVLADSAPPWKGLLFPAERAQHAAILGEFDYLAPHEVLPKWLYLTAEQDHFEELAAPILACLRQRDPRFGVVPVPRKRKTRRSAHAPPPVEDGRPPHLR